MVESSATLKIQSKQINVRSSPPKTRLLRLETSLAFSTPPLHSIPLFPPFATKPELPCSEGQTRAEILCFLSLPTAASSVLLPQSDQFSSNVRGSARAGRRVHGGDREGTAGPPRPHRQQELRAHHAPPRVRP